MDELQSVVSELKAQVSLDKHLPSLKQLLGIAYCKKRGYVQESVKGLALERSAQDALRLGVEFEKDPFAIVQGSVPKP